jgi:hypothetical protein
MSDEKQDREIEAENVDSVPAMRDDLDLEDLEPLEDQTDGVKGGGIPKTPAI